MRAVRRSGASLREIEDLYTRRFHEYASLAAAIVRDREAARDAVQEAFAKAVRTRSSFRSDGSIDAWLWRTVVNTALDERRRRTYDIESLAGSSPPSSNGHRPDGEVAAAIGRLPERQRLVLFLRYYADLDYATIAETLDIAAGTVAATLNAAHRALRRLLEEVQT
jgi:RNA polymerase sigma factor (sigma-70 family)